MQLWTNATKSEGAKFMSALQCIQEEADGCLLLHACHAASEGYQAIVICSEDTDAHVYRMALEFKDTIGVHLFQKCMNRSQTRMIDVTKISMTLGTMYCYKLCRALVYMHAYTGCDTVSGFTGKGKTIQIADQQDRGKETFAQLGQTWNPLTDAVCPKVILYHVKGCGMIYSVLKKERWRATSFHHAKTTL